MQTIRRAEKLADAVTNKYENLYTEYQQTLAKEKNHHPVKNKKK
jgi:hypothetical protein